MELKGSKVLVTGGTGFLGHHVEAELEEAGADVTTWGRHDCDLRDRWALHRALGRLVGEGRRPDAVVHLAAVVGGIGANRDNPGRFFYENAVMGIELLEACRLWGIPKVAIAGTVCAYPKFTPTPFDEDDLWQGYPEETNAPYGLAKRMLLVQAQAYRQQYGSNFIYLLPVNLYGPGDNFDPASSHVIPALIRRFIEARDAGQDEVKVWGSGGATREFLYVRDAARGFRLALENYDSPEPVNLGSGAEVSIEHLAYEIAGMVGYLGELSFDKSYPDGQPKRQLSTHRALVRFGFRAQTTLREGLRETIRWYEKSRHGAAPLPERSSP